MEGADESTELQRHPHYLDWCTEIIFFDLVNKLGGFYSLLQIILFCNLPKMSPLDIQFS